MVPLKTCAVIGLRAGAVTLRCDIGHVLHEGSPKGHIKHLCAPADSEDIHAALVGKDLHLKIRDDDSGVTITVSTAPVSGSSS